MWNTASRAWRSRARSPTRVTNAVPVSTTSAGSSAVLLLNRGTTVPVVGVAVAVVGVAVAVVGVTVPVAVAVGVRVAVAVEVGVVAVEARRTAAVPRAVF